MSNGGQRLRYYFSIGPLRALAVGGDGIEGYRVTRERKEMPDAEAGQGRRQCQNLSLQRRIDVKGGYRQPPGTLRGKRVLGLQLLVYGERPL